MFFFFQAEDGIRGGHVTGVQTCALPISLTRADRQRRGSGVPSSEGRCDQGRPFVDSEQEHTMSSMPHPYGEIGRASCRERVEMSVCDVDMKRNRVDEGRKRVREQ